jgi:hypothetical protein
MFNSKVELAYQLFKKTQFAYLKDIPMFSKVIFYGSSFRSKFSKRLISMFGSCVCSKKKWA